MKSYKHILAMALALAALFCSCTKMNDLHQPYLDRGETVYAQKIDTAGILTGINRQVLTIYCPKQRAVGGVISWNLGTSTQEFEIPQPVPEFVTVTIDNLVEGAYTYTVVTYDADGNKSIPFEITGSVVSQETYDSIRDNLCLSAWYRAFDNLAGGGGIPTARAATWANAQNFNGAAWFSWSCDPIPGAKVIFEYPSTRMNDASTTEYIYDGYYEVDGATIQNGAWFNKLTDALVEPKDKVPFRGKTVIPPIYAEGDFEEVIDMGEQYEDEVRYYTYSFHIEKDIFPGWESDWTEDIW